MAFPVKELLSWYHRHRRDLPWRNTTDIYRIWVSEVMLQQTQVTTVIPYYHRFLRRFPDILSLSRAGEEEVLKLWEGIGYYNRCRNLHRAARMVESAFAGKIPRSPDRFRRLPGVGPYIEAAVMSIAVGLPLPAVDGNVLRVYTRLMGIDDDIRRSSTRKRITGELARIIPADAPGDFNQAVMELGALICIPRSPRCLKCPLRRVCRARINGRTGDIPRRSPRAPVPEYSVSIAVILRGNKFFIQKRAPEGHLAGMWEFPGGKAREGETPEQALRREIREELDIDVDVIKKVAEVRHAYTHFKIDLHVFLCRSEAVEFRPLRHQPFKWITVRQIDQYPFQAANHKFFEKLRDILKKNS